MRTGASSLSGAFGKGVMPLVYVIRSLSALRKICVSISDAAADLAWSVDIELKSHSTAAVKDTIWQYFELMLPEIVCELRCPILAPK